MSSAKEALRITDAMVATVQRYIAGVSPATALRMLEAVRADDPLVAEIEELRTLATAADPRPDELHICDSSSQSTENPTGLALTSQDHSAAVPPTTGSDEAYSENKETR